MLWMLHKPTAQAEVVNFSVFVWYVLLMILCHLMSICLYFMYCIIIINIFTNTSILCDTHLLLRTLLNLLSTLVENNLRFSASINSEAVSTKKMTSGFPTSAMAVDSLRLLPPDRSHARLLVCWTRPSRCVMCCTTCITQTFMRSSFCLICKFLHAHHGLVQVSIWQPLDC